MAKNQAEMQAGKMQYGKAVEAEFIPIDFV